MATQSLKIARGVAERVSPGSWFQPETVRGKMSKVIVLFGVYLLEVDTISLDFNKMANWDCNKPMYYFVCHAQPTIHPSLA